MDPGSVDKGKYGSVDVRDNDSTTTSLQLPVLSIRKYRKLKEEGLENTAAAAEYDEEADGRQIDGGNDDTQGDETNEDDLSSSMSETGDMECEFVSGGDDFE